MVKKELDFHLIGTGVRIMQGSPGPVIYTKDFLCGLCIFCVRILTITLHSKFAHYIHVSLRAGTAAFLFEGNGKGFGTLYIFSLDQ